MTEKELSDLTLNIKKYISELAVFNATPGNGITRFPFTKEASKACDYIENLMKDAGLDVSRDNSGAVIGRLAGESEKCILLESHYDTVQHGGAYDGAAGVFCAIEAARVIAESGKKPAYTIEVMATNDEEGARFSRGFFTSMAALGRIDAEYCKNEKDKDGVSIYDAMKACGLEPEKLPREPRKDISAVFEVHCEQGPVLEKAGKQLGIVDAITGAHRFFIELFGRSDHAGTTPMNDRCDPVVAVSSLIQSVTDRAKSLENSVSTIGRMEVFPGIVNVVANRVELWIDFRSTDQKNIDVMRAGILSDLEELEKTRGVSFKAAEKMADVPVIMNENLKKHLEASCGEFGYSYMRLPSGAGHDAQIFAEIAPAAMLFVPSIGGRSHCPQEKTDEKYLAMAVNVISNTVLKLCEEGIK